VNKYDEVPSILSSSSEASNVPLLDHFFHRASGMRAITAGFCLTSFDPDELSKLGG